MATTTFTGPVRSESTLKTVSKNSSTGAITEVITLGDGPVALGDENKTLDNATHSGRTLVVPALAANRTITLPAPVAGSHFKFIYGGAAEEAENADNVSVYSDGNSNSKLTLTDFGLFEINILAKDSTNYYIWGQAEGADVPAFADQ